MSSAKSFISPQYRSKKIDFEPAELDTDMIEPINAAEPIVEPLVGRRRGLFGAPSISIDTSAIKEKVPEMSRRRFIKTGEDDLSHIVYKGTMDSIRFCFFSSTEVTKFSVVELTEPKLQLIDKTNGVYDLRMGPSEHGEICETCSENIHKCPGHFGSIALAAPIPHPLCSKNILNFLQCFCYKCHRLVMTEAEIKLKKFDKLTSARFNAIREDIEKNVTVCQHPDCNKILPIYSFNDDTYYKRFSNNDQKVEMSYMEIYDIFSNIVEEDIYLLGLKDERYTLYDIQDAYIDSLVHPSRLIIQSLPVLPPCARPYQVKDNEPSHDDLSILYSKIISDNNDLKKPEKLSENARKDKIQNLVNRIRVIFDNTKKKENKPSQKNPYWGIKERISSKQGHIRKYLLGKRTNFSARTVIGGDNTIDVNEIIVPPQIASTLSIPIRVNAKNLDYCQSLFDEGIVNCIFDKNGKEFKKSPSALTNTKETYYRMDDLVLVPDLNGNETRVDIYSFLMSRHPDWFDASGVVIARDKIGDILSPYQIIRREYVRGSNDIPKQDSGLFSDAISDKKSKNDQCILQEKLIPPRVKKTFKLRPGYTIERQSRDGDWVVFNRQPTLWKGSMQAKQIKVLPGKTIRMSLCTTKAFNADHDGDKHILSSTVRRSIRC